MDDLTTSGTSSAQLTRNGIFLWNPRHQAVLDGDTDRFEKGGRPPILLLVLIVAVLLLAAFLDGKDLYLRVVGETAPGIVTEHHTGEYYSRGTRHITYFVTYEFVPIDTKVTYTSDTEIDSDAYDRSPLGAKIDVAYDPRSPDISQPVSEVRRFPFMTTIILIGGAVGGYSLWHRWHSRRQLRHAGQVIQGRLTSLTSLKVGGRSSYYQIKLEFAFNTPYGNTVNGKTVRNLSVPAYKNFVPPEPDTLIAVLYVDDRHYALL